MRLIIASNNAHKVREIKEILGDYFSEILSLKEAGIAIDVEEDGETFEQNALKKAQEVLKIADADAALSDDSGLMVDALDGAPGVYSARFAGEGHDDAANNAKLMDMMRLVPEEKRTARFVSAVALARRGKEPMVCRGAVEGSILYAPQGENGFGYDPLFFYAPAGLSFAQMSAENKNAIRHDEDARHCLLILDAEGKDGFLVDPQGHNYARYSAFVPNARSLLTPDMGIDRSYLSPAEPWRDESRDEMLRMTLRVNGKPDYTLVLPADEEYLDAVKAYLDIDVFADAMLCDIRFKVPYIGELICDTDCPAVEDYNDFAEALEGIWQQDGALLTYAAVLEAEKPETLHRACELLRNLNNYQRIVDTYGYGQRRLQVTLGLDDEAVCELEGYMDFEKYGTDCMENDHVIETEFGRLRRLDPPFPEQTQGQQMFQ